MTTIAERYRQEATLFEEAAQVVTLLSDKEDLLAEAWTLRRRADEMEARHEATRTRVPVSNSVVLLILDDLP